jgi:hypothetical protein
MSQETGESWEDAIDRVKEDRASKAHNEEEAKNLAERLAWEAAITASKTAKVSPESDKETKFDPARALIKNTLEENYTREIGRLMGVPDGESPEKALDPISLKIYQQHLSTKESNINAVIERLATKAEKEGRPLDHVNDDEAIKALAETLFGS